jgi:hypothetical protein
MDEMTKSEAIQWMQFEHDGDVHYLLDRLPRQPNIRMTACGFTASPPPRSLREGDRPCDNCLEVSEDARAAFAAWEQSQTTENPETPTPNESVTFEEPIEDDRTA